MILMASGVFSKSFWKKNDQTSGLVWGTLLKFQLMSEVRWSLASTVPSNNIQWDDSNSYKDE